MKHLYWTASLISLILIWVIFKLSVKDIRSTRKSRVFVFVLSASIALISVDIVWVLSEMGYLMLPRAIDYILAGSYYALTGVAGYSCFLYSEHMQNETGGTLPRWFVAVTFIPSFVLSVISFVSIGTGWLFTIGADGVHARGAAYIIQPIIATLYPVISYRS